MSYWADFGAWEERRRELLREAERGRLARVLREARKGRKVERRVVEPVVEAIEVRWGLQEDEPGIAQLLELNGMPRWIAFEERFIVAEMDGELLAALRYRTASKRLLLGLLIVDPWAEERPLAVALYAGTVALAQEAGIGEVRARPNSYGNYLGEDGYRWWRGSWHADAALPVEVRSELPASGWRRMLALLGIVAVPFHRTFRG